MSRWNRGGSRGAFQAHTPLLGQMWECPNRKMNRYVEHVPPFGIKKEVCAKWLPMILSV